MTKAEEAEALYRKHAAERGPAWADLGDGTKGVWIGYVDSGVYAHAAPDSAAMQAWIEKGKVEPPAVSLERPLTLGERLKLKGLK